MLVEYSSVVAGQTTWEMVNFILMANLSRQQKMETLKQFADEDHRAREGIDRLAKSR